MPNWVFNTLTVEGNPESVIKLKNQMNKPFTVPVESHGDLSFNVKEVTYSNPVFAFWNIINPLDMGITAEEYACQPKRSELSPNDPNWWADTNKVSKTDNSWYAFNNREWGTKWDVAVSDDAKYPETQIYSDEPNGENHVLVYGFNTAWGVPVVALEKLSAQYPDLLFTLSYEEETGWGGEDEYLRGELIEGSSYNWKCRECDYEETDEPPYCETCEFDMCPECGYGEPMDEDRAQCEEHREKE